MSNLGDQLLALDQMDKGFLLCRPQCDDAGQLNDFIILSVSWGFENFAVKANNNLANKSLLKDVCLGELTEPLMALFTKVIHTGLSKEGLIPIDEQKSLKAFAFPTGNQMIACYLEYQSGQAENNRQEALGRFNNSEDAFWMRKGDDILFFNPAFEKLFGISKGQLRKVSDILSVVDKRDYEHVQNTLRMDGERIDSNYSLEFRIKRRDGIIKWLWLKTFALKRTYEEPKKAGVFIDVSARKHLEEELFRSNREIIILNELFQKAAEHIELNELMDIISRIINEYMAFDILGIHLNDESSQQLKFKYCPQIPEELLKEEEFLVQVLELPDRVYKEKKSIHICVSEYPNENIRMRLMRSGLQYISCFPILYDGKCMGVLSIGNKQSDWTLREKDFIMAICNQLAVLINHSRLYEELKQELEMRKKAEKQNDLIFNTSIDLMAIMSDDMRFLRISPQCHRCLGWDEKEFLGESLLRFVHSEDKENTLISLDALTNEEAETGIEHRLVCKDGSFRWIAWNAQVVTESQKKLIIMTGRDMTRNKEMEEKNRDLERAYHLEAVKMEFFANISHEFRTPLNIILSALQLIEHSLATNIALSPVHGREMRHLKSIKQNAFRLLKLVNNLIDITKLDSGYLKLYPANHDIVKVVRSITESVNQYIEGKEIRLLFESNVARRIISCDADMIERILLNLLSNAVKYTEKEGCIKVSVKDMKKVIRISVKDSGIGISEDMLDLIFERFIQVDKPLSRRCEGSGIGLSLVKSLVELHNGRIYVNSTVNEGSEFTFELPVTTIEKESYLQGMEPSREERIHRINVEFSDIYSLN